MDSVRGFRGMDLFHIYRFFCPKIASVRYFPLFLSASLFHSLSVSAHGSVRTSGGALHSSANLGHCLLQNTTSTTITGENEAEKIYTHTNTRAREKKKKEQNSGKNN